MKQLEAVHHGHAQVCEEDVKALGQQVAQAFFPVARGDDFGAGVGG